MSGSKHDHMVKEFILLSDVKRIADKATRAYPQD